jgi:hypothetical protein
MARTERSGLEAAGSGHEAHGTAAPYSTGGEAGGSYYRKENRTQDVRLAVVQSRRTGTLIRTGPRRYWARGGHVTPTAPSLVPVAAPVLLISGCSAIGKSTVSRLLAECLDSSVHIPSDAFLRFFDDPFPDPATPKGAYRYEVTGAALAASAAQFALGGYTVILDGPMFPDGADGVAEICWRRGVLVHYAVLRADLPTCLERAKRRDPVGPPDLHGFTALHAKFIDLGESEANVIDASSQAEQVVASVLSAFKSGRLMARWKN